MPKRLLWKLLLTNILPVVGVIFLVVWVAVDKLAANYFMALMDTYDVSPKEIHQMFLTSVHRYLIWATLAALGVAFVLSYLLTRRVLKPLSQMIGITREIAGGNYSLRTTVAGDDEVGQLGQAFNHMTERLQKVESLRKAMVADVAHELRTPLTNLRGYLEALNDGVLPPEKATLSMLEQEVLRLVHLVENLQQLARADAARAFLKKEPVSLVQLVEQLLVLHALNFTKKGIQVETAWLEGDCMVSADRDKVLQAMQNLMDNCCKYSPEGGRVRISISAVKKGVQVSFSNSGKDIGAEDLSFIFERFFRVDRSRSREGGGAGIGLAITRELIEAHGGTVGAESRDGVTTVWFILPL